MSPQAMDWTHRLWARTVGRHLPVRTALRAIVDAEDHHPYLDVFLRGVNEILQYDMIK